MRIMGYDYKLDMSKSKKDLHGAIGWCNLDQYIIEVANDLPIQNIHSTILHEIIEAVNFHTELKLDHHQIMTLESTLYQVLNDAGIDFSPITNNEEIKILNIKV